MFSAAKSISGDAENFDTIIIGAGQAGLALGYYLQQQNQRFLLLEAAMQIGQPWRNRYDSLTLFTPAEYSQLPGYALNLPKAHYPTKDQIAGYLQDYAAHFQLPVALGQPVLSVTKANGFFTLSTASKTYLAKNVVVATGPFQTPFIPEFATEPSEIVVQVHSAQYRNPAQFPAGNVLVVGAGNSGAQIAVELAKTHQVTLSVKKKPRFSGLRLLGKSVFWWGTKTGALFAPPSTFLGRKMLRQQDVIYGLELAQLLEQKEIALRAEIECFMGDTVQFKDGGKSQFQAIVWATGFRPEYGWLRVDGALAENGSPVHQNGVSPVTGLFYVGLSWQRSRSSALLLGAGRDAQFIAQRLLGENTSSVFD
ncbi:NAD(P)/FAD-dependent oxidoreductase [Rufibacter sp. LB8]|uniref:flavin-containing monooxygenase n=1 Tax=Rufibacter sp. LB8 TaxID=2777781 RepID=UPI00178C6D49|nr:NAD(P)/FAD-dependent oxidoreductase [Rufibacter sp. LB8]